MTQPAGVGVFSCLLLLAVTSWWPADARWLDLSYSFDNTTHYWPGSTPFNLTQVIKGQTEYYWYEANDYRAAEHGGTHMDAPSHFWRGGWSVDEIPPERFIANVAVLDISERSARDRDAELTLEDLDAWKAAHGEFPNATLLLVRTGYARHWNNRSMYFGIDPDKPDQLHFPGVGEMAARQIAREETVVGVGIDTASVDPGRSKRFQAHQILFESSKYAVENVADMSEVPPAGARIVALPMKIDGGSGAPCRVMVELPEVSAEEGEVTTAAPEQVSEESAARTDPVGDPAETPSSEAAAAADGAQELLYNLP